MKSMGWYTLDKNNNPVPTSSLFEVSKFLENNDRIVQKTKVFGFEVSTVFLGLDHNFLNVGPPVLFETMIFSGPFDGFQSRCCTWDEAVEMHNKVVKQAKKWTLITLLLGIHPNTSHWGNL